MSPKRGEINDSQLLNTILICGFSLIQLHPKEGFSYHTTLNRSLARTRRSRFTSRRMAFSNHLGSCRSLAGHGSCQFLFLSRAKRMLIQHSLGWQNKWQRRQEIGLFSPRLSLLKGKPFVERQSLTLSQTAKGRGFVSQTVALPLWFLSLKTELLFHLNSLNGHRAGNKTYTARQGKVQGLSRNWGSPCFFSSRQPFF